MPGIIKKPQAQTDLINIWVYIGDDDPDKADQFLDMLDEKLQMLAANPLMGRSREELASTLRSFPVGRYIIFYRPIIDGVEVVRVLHSAQDISTEEFPG
jgi:toxin ParE1/3/4